MKKFFQSKGFIVSALAVLCVAILGVCWFVSRDRTDEFRPDESPPSSTSSDWSDGGVQSGSAFLQNYFWPASLFEPSAFHFSLPCSYSH